MTSLSVALFSVVRLEYFRSSLLISTYLQVSRQLNPLVLQDEVKLVVLNIFFLPYLCRDDLPSQQMALPDRSPV